MKHPERIEDYLEHIADAIDRAASYAGQVGNAQALEANDLVQDAIVRNLTVIGEAVGQIQKQAPEFIERHPELPWPQMRGMRNRIVHDYFDIDWERVWNTVQYDLPPLRALIDNALAELKRERR